MEQLVAYYRGSTALLTMSEHEGFCVPLLEAMHSDLPIVATNSGAIPETLGRAGILLDDRSPEHAAVALERVVHDAQLRKDLVAQGRRQLIGFSADAVADRLTHALGLAEWELPAWRRRKLAVVSSERRSGIHHYALALCDGLRAAGHEATFVGTKHHDTADLLKKLAGK